MQSQCLVFQSINQSASLSYHLLQVNGFEVYDPEEAVLMFLEQDQDITLTVARKLKVFIDAGLYSHLKDMTAS